MIDIKEKIERYMEVNHMEIDELLNKKDLTKTIEELYFDSEDVNSYYYELGINSQAKNFYEHTSSIRSTF